MADIDHSSFAYSYRPNRVKRWKQQKANTAQVDAWLAEKGMDLEPHPRSDRYQLEVPGGRTAVYYPATGYWGMLDEEDKRKVKTTGQGDGSAFLKWYQNVRDGHDG